MTHFVKPGELFDIVADQLIDDGFKIDWVGFGRTVSAKQKKKKKIKYTCPDCGLNAWGKPDLNLICGECESQLEINEIDLG